MLLERCWQHVGAYPLTKLLLRPQNGKGNSTEATRLNEINEMAKSIRQHGDLDATSSNYHSNSFRIPNL